MKKSVVFAVSVIFCFFLIHKSNAQTFDTLDQQLISAFDQNFPDWKWNKSFVLSKVGHFKNNNVWMTITGRKEQKHLMISVNLQESKEKASENLDRSFQLNKIIPQPIEMPKIGDKAFIFTTPRYKSISFLKENMTVNLSVALRRTENEKNRDDTASLESETDFLTQVAKIVSDNIVGEKTYSYCRNDFYKPALLPERTIEEKLIAAVFHGQLQKVKDLVTQGANLNFKDTSGETALHYAIRSECFESVKILVEARADLNVKNKNGESPLILAAKNRNSEITKFLIETGADVNLKNNKEMSVLKILREEEKLHLNNQNKPEDYKNLKEIIELLIEAGAKE